MNKQKTLLVLLVLVFLSSMICSSAAAAEAKVKTEGSYFSHLNQTYARGLKNIIVSPAEIYVGVRDAKDAENKCPAGGKYVMGFFKGFGKTFVRLASGLCDLVGGWLPNYQQWPSLQPETLF